MHENCKYRLCLMRYLASMEAGLCQLSEAATDLLGDVPAHVANGRALLINDYAASPLQARPPSLVAGAKRAA